MEQNGSFDQFAPKRANEAQKVPNFNLYQKEMIQLGHIKNRTSLTLVKIHFCVSYSKSSRSYFAA